MFLNPRSTKQSQYTYCHLNKTEKKKDGIFFFTYNQK